MLDLKSLEIDYYGFATPSAVITTLFTSNAFTKNRLQSRWRTALCLRTVIKRVSIETEDCFHRMSLKYSLDISFVFLILLFVKLKAVAYLFYYILKRTLMLIILNSK